VITSDITVLHTDNFIIYITSCLSK